MPLGLFTSVVETGGVQRIGRHVGTVLGDLDRERGEECTLLSFADPPGTHELEVGSESIEVRGFGRNRPRFVLAALRAARRTDTAVLGHPHLAPLAPAIQALPGSRAAWVLTYGIDVWEPLPLHRRLGLRAATGVLALSTFTADAVAREQGVDRDAVQILPPALDPSFEESARRVSQPLDVDGNPVGLTVARLTTDDRAKGIDKLVTAWASLVETHPDARLVVVGDGDDRSRLETLAADLHVDGNVSFTGELTGPDLVAAYEAADLFAMPSKKEGFGIVFLEAMARGLPVVGGAHKGTLDVIEDGEVGYLVDHDDRDGLVKRLRTLAADPDLRERMGEAGRRRVDEHYTLEAFSERLREIVA